MITDEDKDVGVIDTVPTLEEIPEAVHPDGEPLMEYVYTNDHKNPMLPQLFHFLYQATFDNKVGVMHALNRETKKVHTLIVGVETLPDGQIMCVPVAKLLTAEEQNLYCAPDGVGGYVGYEPEVESSGSDPA